MYLQLLVQYPCLLYKKIHVRNKSLFKDSDLLTSLEECKYVIYTRFVDSLFVDSRLVD